MPNMSGSADEVIKYDSRKCWSNYLFSRPNSVYRQIDDSHGIHGKVESGKRNRSGQHGSDIRPNNHD